MPFPKKTPIGDEEDGDCEDEVKDYEGVGVEVDVEDAPEEEVMKQLRQHRMDI